MTDTSRYLVLERCNGRLIPSIEYANSARTRRLMAEGRAKRIAITPWQALRGPTKLMAMAMEAKG